MTAAAAQRISPGVLEGLHIQEAWARLEASAIEASAFHGPAMFAAAVGRIEPTGWQIVEARDPQGRLVACLPLRAARVVPVIGPRLADGFWSHYGPRMPVLLDAGDPLDAALRLLEACRTAAPILRLRHQILDGPSISALRAAALALGGAVYETAAHGRAVLNTRQPEAEVLGPALTDPKRTRELRRQMRKLSERGSLEHLVLTTPADVTRSLEAFVRLEKASWKGRAGTSLADDPRRLAFAGTFLTELARSGRVRVDRLDLDGIAIAVIFTLFSGTVGHLWKVAHDEAHAWASPGMQVARLATEGLLADPAVEVVDSLATADHPLVDRLWSQRLRVGTVVMALDPSTRRLAAEAARTMDRLDNLRGIARAMRSRFRR